MVFSPATAPGSHTRLTSALRTAILPRFSGTGFSMQQGYLPHLDGLRAIAVGLVVLYHAGYSSIGERYLGVYVFFVLSGFLITGQLDKYMKGSRFSFSP